MVHVTVGANFRLARLFHALTLEDVATALGKTRQYAHKLETEQVVPSEAVVGAIATLTHVQPSFFYQPLSANITEELCHFRKHFTARAPIKHVALAKGEMFRRLVNGVEAHVELPTPAITPHEVRSLVDIEVAADTCRREWGLGLGPLQNTVRLAERLGAVVTSFKNVSREVDAYSISAARPIIVVNADEASACRLRFDVAHELGHLVMHVGVQTGDRKTEGEANRFAGALLLPRSTFVKEFPRMRGSHINWQALSELKLRWRVSKAALLYRAKQLSLLSEDQYRTGVIRLHRGGEARMERDDVGMAREIPEMFPQAVRVGCAHTGGDFDAYCRSLDVSAVIVNEFIGAPAPLPSTRDAAPSDEFVDSSNVVSLASRRRIGTESGDSRRRG